MEIDRNNKLKIKVEKKEKKNPKNLKGNKYKY